MEQQPPKVAEKTPCVAGSALTVLLSSSLNWISQETINDISSEADYSEDTYQAAVDPTELLNTKDGQLKT